MFEKEAIRHAFEVTIGLDCLIKPTEEFTYEELNDHLQEKADDFQDGAEFGYNKANEWHYVKDGDLPKNGEKNILLYCKEHFYTTSYVTAGYFEEDVFYNDCDMEEDVIAWKEIVLP